MRGAVTLILAVASVLGVALVTVALATRSDHASTHRAVARVASASSPNPVEVVRFQRNGPTEACRGDFPSVSPIRGFTLPATSRRYRVVLTVSLQYRAYAAIHPNQTVYSVEPHMVASTAAQPPAAPVVRPTGWHLLSTGGKLSTATLVSRVSSVYGGSEYRLYLEPGMRPMFCLDPNGNRAKTALELTRVVYTVRAWPS